MNHNDLVPVQWSISIPGWGGYNLILDVDIVNLVSL